MESMKSLHVPFFEVWILGRASDSDVTMVRIVPELLQVTLNVREMLEKTKDQRSFMVPEKRGTSTEFRDLGLTYLPIP